MRPAITTLERTVLLTLAALAGCTFTPVRQRDWPVDVPPLSHYETVYDNDSANQAIQTKDDYLTWVIRFYQGWEGYPRGWRDIRRNATAAIAADRRAAVDEKFARLGKFISGEWAKDVASRAIFTSTVAAWGDALAEAVERGEVDTLLDRVAEDVEALLSRKLDADSITLDRYYEPSTDDALFDP